MFPNIYLSLLPPHTRYCGRFLAKFLRNIVPSSQKWRRLYRFSSLSRPISRWLSGQRRDQSRRAYDLALLRAAEVTREHGFNYFAVVDVTNTSSVQAYTVRQIVHIDTPTARAPVLGSIGSTQSGKLVRLEQPSLYCEPGTVLAIKCFATKPEKTFAYEAAALEQSLRRKQKARLP